MYTKFENNPSRVFLVIALTPLRAAGGGRLRRKTITSPDPSDTGDIISQIGSGNGLAPNRRQAIIWTNADLIHWRIYAALGGGEFWLIKKPLAIRDGDCICEWDMSVILVVITGTTILMSYLQVNSLQLIWKSGTCRFHLHVPDVQMSWETWPNDSNSCRAKYFIK